MHTINNHLYIDLSQHIDLKGFEKIEPDIILGIVKSKMYIVDDGCNTQNLFDSTFPSLVNSCFYDSLRDTTNPYYEYYKELDFNRESCKMFNRYLGKYTQMGQLLTLRVWNQAGRIDLKGSGSGCFDQPSYDNFSKLRNWISELKAFDEIGRIVFFFNAPNEPHSIHKDTYLGSPDNFILINLHPENKDVFIVNQEDQSRTIVPAKAFVFDPRNYHGTVGGDFYSWTLRIDGKFNKEWAEQVGIAEYYGLK